MMRSRLGALKRLSIREAWHNEASEFTPWLAKSENMAQLGSVLGMELELEGTEVSVGPYSADILAKDTATDGYVVIENQLEKTNHDHLGKLITYASILDATAVVWVASHFTEEHRKALEWLDDNSSEDLNFYGVRVDLWQIDDSDPAVRFEVAAGSAGAFKKAAVARGSTQLTEAKKLQLDFWTVFRDALAETGAVPSLRTPRPRHWYNVALGRSGIQLSAIADRVRHRTGVRVYIRGKYGGTLALRKLREEKDEIEKELGFTLEWDPHPEAEDKTIAIFREADLWQRDEWSEYITWLVQTTVKLRDVFGPRVRALDLESEMSDSRDPDEASGGDA